MYFSYSQTPKPQTPFEKIIVILTLIVKVSTIYEKYLHVKFGVFFLTCGAAEAAAEAEAAL